MDWRPVVGSEQFYEVSEAGDIRRIKSAQSTHSGRRLTPFHDRRGYVIYNLNSGGVRRRVKAHRVVLEAFVGPPPEGQTFALHWDDNPRNNHISNLRWGSRDENGADRARNNRTRRVAGSS